MNAMKNVFCSLPIVFIALLALSGCADVRETFGLVNKPPDEFAVVDHPPLSMPPDFDLKPPRPGASAQAGDNASERAAKAIYGDHTMQLVTQKGVSSLDIQRLPAAEQALVTQSGSDKADPAIRTILDREAGDRVVTNRKLIDELLFWRAPTKQDQGLAVNPVLERKRIEAARARGLPVNTGGTPAYDKKGATIVP